MPTQPSSPTEQIEWLRRSSPQLAESLRELSDDSSARTIERIDSLSALLREYGAVHNGVVEETRSWLPASSGGQPSLVELQTACEARATAMELGSFINRVLSIRTDDVSGDAPVWQEEASGIAQNLRTGELDEPTKDLLATGRHPLCALLSLVEEGAVLGDDVWERRFDEVREAYGSAVAAAAARGRYELDEPGQPEQTQETDDS